MPLEKPLMARTLCILGFCVGELMAEGLGHRPQVARGFDRGVEILGWPGTVIATQRLGDALEVCVIGCRYHCCSVPQSDTRVP